MVKSCFNILIIEDNPADARFVCELLKESDGISFKVTHTTLLNEGLDKLSKEILDVLLLDLDLPDSRGLESLDKIIQVAPKIPIIVLTGNVEEEVGIRAIQRHATDYLVKGKINADALIRSIRYSIERKHSEEGLYKLNRMLRALTNSSQAIMRMENELAFLREACQIILNDCGHAMVWIGFAENDQKKSIRAVAQAGFDEGYIEQLNITWADTERGNGPTGIAVRTGKPAICKNMLVDPKFKPWREEALKRGYASSISIPLIDNNKVFGAVTIYSREPDPFSEDEAKLLEELAGDLSRGITMFRLRAKNREAEDVLKRDKKILEKLVRERSQELIDAQIKLEQAKRLSDIGTLAMVVAHELRNPLASIKLASFNIKRKANNPQLESHLNNIDTKIIESEHIIDNLLFYSKIKVARLEDINAHNLLMETIDEVTRRYSDRALSIKQDVDSIKDLIIQADPVQIKEVFINLLNNAADALNGDKGIIELNALIDNNFLSVSIKDNGEGIESQLLERIFEPFFTTKAKGTGLGLAVSKQIISLHNGSIKLSSKKGEGTIVTVTLPVDKTKNA